MGARPPGVLWRESEVNERLFDVMDRAFDEVVRYAELHRVNNRIAAYMLAIGPGGYGSQVARHYA
jgi:Glutamate dehydrogenase/leucine dehydrogenase